MKECFKHFDIFFPTALKEYTDQHPYIVFLCCYLFIIILLGLSSVYLAFFLQKENFFSLDSALMMQIFFNVIALITAIFITTIQFVNNSINYIRKEYSIDTEDLTKNYYRLPLLASVYFFLIFDYFLMMFFVFTIGVSNLLVSIFFFITAVCLIAFFFYLIHIFEMQKIENIIDYYKSLSETGILTPEEVMFLCKQINAIYIKLTTDNVCLSGCKMPVNRTKILGIYEKIILDYYDGCCNIPEELGHLGNICIQSKNFCYLDIILATLKNIERQIKKEKPAFYHDFVSQEIQICRDIFEKICDNETHMSRDDLCNRLSHIRRNLLDTRTDLSSIDSDKIYDVNYLLDSITRKINNDYDY